MIFVECNQGTESWHAARCGKITASCFADAISMVGGLTEQQAQYVAAIRGGADSKVALAAAGYKAAPTAESVRRALAGEEVGQPSDIAKRYAADLAIERISGKPHGEPPKAWVLERGHEMETAARRIYEGRTGAFVTEAGICLTDDGVFGYSTDGLVDDDGLIEIKAPIDSTKILAMWATGDTSEYDHQMQGGMWITGRKWTDFIMYVPDLAAVGKDLYVKRVFRDDAFIDDMVARLAQFDEMVRVYEGVLRCPVEGAVDAEFDPDFLEVAAAPAAPEPQPVSQVLVDALERRREARPALAAAVTITDVARVPAAVTAPTLRLGQINERLAPVALTADGLARLGFAPAATDKSAKLYHESDFPAICAALVRHINAVQANEVAA
jgi:exodeoxyribonuclease (lambda-induced)